MGESLGDRSQARGSAQQRGRRWASVGIPEPPTPLIGREAEVAGLLALLALLDDETVRCVTLTGPGGVGKTRLAVQVAARLAERTPNGVWFVPLATVRTPDGVAPALARSLGLRQHGRRSAVAAVVRFLGEQRAVLVLDNFERVAVAAPVIASLLGQCPGTRVLATSRVPLGLYGEHRVEVRSLPVAETNGTDASAAPAVRLFADRAQAAWSGFALTDENLPVVAAICRRLDGLPLAIELAASWIDVLPPEAILDRLRERRLRLAGGGVDQPERLQALDETVAWSHDLLGPEEQRLFRRLSVFSGGFGLEAAEQVAVGWTADEASAASVLDLLAGLVHKSLLRRAAGATADAPRFELLETIRDFAIARLETAGETGEAHRRHAAWCERFVLAARATMGGPGQEAAVRRVEIEHDNLRAALRWALDRHDPVGPRLAGELWRFWYVRGYLSEGRRWLEAATADRAASTPAAQALVDLGLGVIAQAQGDAARANEALSAALTACRAAGDVAGCATALNFLGLAARDVGDLARAAGLHEEALALGRQSGDRWRLTLSLNLLAADLGRLGRSDEARPLLEESFEIATERGDRWTAAAALTARGDLDHHAGRVDDAVDAYESALAVYREIGHPQGEATLLTRLGTIDAQRGDRQVAEARFELAARRARTADDGRARAGALFGLATVRLANGDAAGAHAAVVEGLTLADDLGDRDLVLTGLRQAAEVARADGDHQHAARIVAATEPGRNAATGDAPAGSGADAPGVEQALLLATAPLRASAGSGGAATAKAAPGPGPDRFHLSPRELDVLVLLAEGRTDRAIGDALFIGHRTVATHVTSILNKLGMETRTGAATFAVRHGLV